MKDAAAAVGGSWLLSECVPSGGLPEADLKDAHSGSRAFPSRMAVGDSSSSDCLFFLQSSHCSDFLPTLQAKESSQTCD